MFHHRRSRDLSLLARGHGMLDGGVEIDCFSQDPKAFSLTGKPLIKPATTKTIKPYKAHKLNLPKTFVTRRGQLVLFTAPEDMIIGKSCSFHEKELATQQAVQDLKTTGRLLDSALDYYPEDNYHLKYKASTEHIESEPDQILTQPGHFTNVYLNSLKKAALNAPQVAEDCLVEDIEEARDKESELLAPCNSEVAPMSECDSGLGQSTISRLSGHSRLSEDRTVFIPHGSDESSFPGEADMLQSSTETKEDVLASLKTELFEQKNGSKTKKASSTKVGKKRHRSTNKQDSTQSPAPVKVKTKKNNTEAKSVKAKRRKNKKDSHSNKHDCNSVESERSIEDNDSEVSGQNQQLTAINMPPSEPKLTVEGVGGVNSGGESVHSGKGSVKMDEGKIGPSQGVSRAEERRREIERKRAEKRELEAQKKREMEEKLRLEEELARATRDIKTTPLNVDDQSDTASMTSVESELPQEKQSVDPPISNWARLRAELDRSKLSQHRWLLMNQGEQVEKELSAEMEEAQEALRRAKEAEEERKRQEQLRLQKMAEEERRRAEEQAGLEEAARRKAAEILSHSHRPTDHTKRLNSELSKQRQEQMFPSKLMFSYFNYVPPPKVKKDKRARGRTPKAKAIKAQQ